MATKPLYQINALISAVDIYDETQSKLQSAINAELYQSASTAANEIKTFKNISVATTAWTNQSSSPDVSDFPWRAAITCSGIDTNYSADVRFAYDAISANSFAPVTNTAANTVYIYADAQPSGSISIPVIICTYIA